MADNEVIIYLNSLGSTFSIREEAATSKTFHSTEPTHEKKICPVI